MLLLTNNRNNDGPDSLYQTLADERTDSSLPVLTVGNAQRLWDDTTYRQGCIERLIQILTDLDLYRGIPRLFIP